jgi:serine/threonine-protein kinase ULK/ATG1
LADFGFCKKLKNFDDLTQTSLGSPLYMAPEVLNGDVYDSKADVWSVGIVLY